MERRESAESDEREGTYEAIQINLLDESGSRDLDDPSSTCGARKRIFSQSDVEFDQINVRKKLNPFSSTLSAAPYYYHDFKTNDKQETQVLTPRGGAAPTTTNLHSLLQTKEF